MLLHRVGPVDPQAITGESYHPAFVPPSSGQHRIDNPTRYDVLYLSTSRAGAVAEAFGTSAEWGDFLTEHPKRFTRLLATFDLPDRLILLDLDDAGALARRSLRPSRVVTRDRTTTQDWALDAHDEGAWAGISWWSYYDPDWTSCGLWCEPGAGTIDALGLLDLESIDGDHDAVIEASAALLRAWY